MAAPVLFVVVFTVAGWLRPDYAASQLEVSALSIGPHGWIQILNFVLTGSLFMRFANGIADLPGKPYRWGARLLFALGICLLLSGPFVMDAPGTPRPHWTLHGWVHRLLGAVAFTLFPVSCLYFGYQFRDKVRWQWFRGWSLGAACIMIIAIGGLKAAQLPSRAPLFADRLGLFQRVILIAYMGWLFTLAWVLGQLTDVDKK